MQKLLALKQAITFLAIFFYLNFFPFMEFIHYRWISQFGKISPKEKMLFGRSQCDKQINKNNLIDRYTSIPLCANWGYKWLQHQHSFFQIFTYLFVCGT
jgi:hypothetical protein